MHEVCETTSESTDKNEADATPKYKGKIIEIGNEQERIFRAAVVPSGVIEQSTMPDKDSHKNLFRKESSRGQEDVNISSNPQRNLASFFG